MYDVWWLSVNKCYNVRSGFYLSGLFTPAHDTQAYSGQNPADWAQHKWLVLPQCTWGQWYPNPLCNIKEHPRAPSSIYQHSQSRGHSINVHCFSIVGRKTWHHQAGSSRRLCSSMSMNYPSTRTWGKYQQCHSRMGFCRTLLHSTSSNLLSPLTSVGHFKHMKDTHKIHHFGKYGPPQVCQFTPVPPIFAPVYIRHELVPSMLSIHFGKYNTFLQTWWSLFSKELAKVCLLNYHMYSVATFKENLLIWFHCDPNILTFLLHTQLFNQKRTQPVFSKPK